MLKLQRETKERLAKKLFTSCVQLLFVSIDVRCSRITLTFELVWMCVPCFQENRSPCSSDPYKLLFSSKALYMCLCFLQKNFMTNVST